MFVVSEEVVLIAVTFVHVRNQMSAPLSWESEVVDAVIYD